jgi:hypothetical protein
MPTCEYHDETPLSYDGECPKCLDDIADAARRWDHVKQPPVSPTYCSGCYRTHEPTDCPHQQG